MTSRHQSADSSSFHFRFLFKSDDSILVALLPTIAFSWKMNEKTSTPIQLESYRFHWCCNFVQIPPEMILVLFLP